jgi:hypothetical protein
MSTPTDFPPPLASSPVSAAPRPRKRRWWLVALVVLALLVVLVIGSLLGLAWFARSAVLRYTDTSPVQLPKVTASAESGAALRERLVKFFEALKGNQSLEPLALTADDLNTLIATGGRNPFKDRLYLTIDEQGLHGEFSVPLGKGVPGKLQGRYLNGRGDVKVVFQDGELRVWVDNLSAHGRPVPKLLAKQLSKRNLAEGLLNNPEAYNTLQQLEAIAVTNSTIVLQPKAP